MGHQDCGISSSIPLTSVMLKKETVPCVVSRSAVCFSDASAESLGVRVKLHLNLILECIDRF